MDIQRLIRSYPPGFTLSVLMLAVWIAAIVAGLPIISAPIILILPGYCLAAALYRDEEALDASERLGLSIGLSISMLSVLSVAISGLSLDLFGPVQPLQSALFIVSALFLIVAAIKVPADQGAGWSRLMAAAIGLKASAYRLLPALALLIAIFAVSSTPVEQPVEFYIVDENGTLSYALPKSITSLSGLVAVVVGQGQRSSYTISSLMDGVLLENVSFSIAKDETFKLPLDHYPSPPENVKDGSTLRLILYRENEPISRLHILLRSR